MRDLDVLVLGGGAAGLMCAIEAAKRGRKVLVIDHAKNPAEKIRISGGGRCNFTNIHCSPANFLSRNPRFCVSALKRYTQQDFLKLVEKHRISWHEKTLGQLFCDNSAKDIIRMLLSELEAAGARYSWKRTSRRLKNPTTGFPCQRPRAVAGGIACCGDRRAFDPPRWARPASAMIWPSASATT